MSKAAKKSAATDDYNAAADATGSYYAAIEAKRKRGDANKATAKPATKRRRKRDDDKPVVVAADVQAAGVVVGPANDNPPLDCVADWAVAPETLAWDIEPATTPIVDYVPTVPAEHDHDEPYKPQIWTAVKVAAIVVLVIGAVAWVL